MDNSEWFYFKEKVSTMIAYLSGAMEFSIDEGSSWRNMMSEWLQNKISHHSIDPVKETNKIILENNAQDYRKWKNSNPKKFKKFIRILIKQDIHFVINKCDYLIVLWDDMTRNGGGTHGEVTMAYWFNKPIFIVNEMSRKENISAWISSCSTQEFNSLNHLKKFLLEKFKPK